MSKTHNTEEINSGSPRRRRGGKHHFRTADGQDYTSDKKTGGAAGAADSDREEMETAGTTDSDREEMETADTVRPLSLLWQFLGVLALLAACAGTWTYMRNHGLFQRQELAGNVDMNTQEIIPIEGTVLAKKSNSLDGVPFYTSPGGTQQGGFFPEGKCIQILEYTNLGGTMWYHTAYCGLDGWLEERFTRPISKEALYIRIGTLVYVNALTEKGIKGYAGPDMGAEVVREGIPYGAEFTVEELTDGWGRVTDEGQTFWIYMYFMGSYPSEYWKIESLRSDEGINLREKPDVHAKSLGKVPENEPVVILEFRLGWGKVNYKGQTGWLKLSYMSPDAVPGQPLEIR